MTESEVRPVGRRLGRPDKAFLLAGFAGALLVALIWGTGILYWHFRVRSAFRTLETTSAPGGTPADDELNLRALETLNDAGCRSLPFFVQALDPSKPIQFLQTSSQFIHRHADAPEDTTITSVDSEVERRRKCEKLREWWKTRGSAEHQVWRFWTDACRPVDPRELVD